MGMGMGMDVLVYCSSLGVAGRGTGTWLAGLAGWLIRCYNDMICPRGGIGLGNGPCLSGTERNVRRLDGLSGFVR